MFLLHKSYIYIYKIKGDISNLILVREGNVGSRKKKRSICISAKLPRNVKTVLHQVLMYLFHVIIAKTDLSVTKFVSKIL